MSLRRHFGEQTLSATEANGHTSKQVIIHEKFADNLRQIYVLKNKNTTYHFTPRKWKHRRQCDLLVDLQITPNAIKAKNYLTKCKEL